jgi:hypothetical protein
VVEEKPSGFEGLRWGKGEKGLVRRQSESWDTPSVMQLRAMPVAPDSERERGLRSQQQDDGADQTGLGTCVAETPGQPGGQAGRSEISTACYCPALPHQEVLPYYYYYLISTTVVLAPYHIYQSKAERHSQHGK